MRLRAFVAFATLIGGLGLAGWAAAGISGWGAGSPDTADAPPQSAISAAPAPATSRHIKTREIESGSAAHLVDLSLLNPQPMYIDRAQPAPARALAAAYVAPAESTAPVRPVLPPSPPPQAKKLIDSHDPGGLTAAQITRIKTNLRLTPDQEEYWRPVEQVLLEIARDVASQKAGGRKILISAEVSQRLYWTAGPLIMSLREDQKREARNLARSMGLQKVASLI
jgi:hypothetical protein